MTLLGLVAVLLCAFTTDAWEQRAVEPRVAFGRSTSCPLQCSESDNFKYVKNMVYVFDYHTSAKVAGGGRAPQLGVSARAHITVAGGCEMILALNTVRLADSGHVSPDFEADLTRNRLRFGFSNGAVTAVCPASTEKRWALNFKRGLLSAFQNTMGKMEGQETKTVEEADVSGTCTSTYTAFTQESGLVNVTRLRGASCVPPPVPRRGCMMTSLLQLLPLFSSEQKCLQMINGGILKEAVCRENLLYPSLLGDSTDGPMVSFTTRLKFAYQLKADFVVVPNLEATRSSLAIEWADERDSLPPVDWLDLVEKMLQILDEDMPNPPLFYRLEELLETLNYEQLTQMLIKLNPELWTTSMMSLVKLGTDSSMKLLGDLIKYNGLSSSVLSETAEYLMKKFPASPEMLDIIENRIRSYGGDLPLSKLKELCDTTDTCEDNERVRELLNYVHRTNGEPQCFVESDNATESAGSSPRSYGYSYYRSYSYNYYGPPGGRQRSALWNTKVMNTWSRLGEWPAEYTPNLEKCTASNDTEELVIALEVLKNSPCEAYDYTKLLEQFKEPSQDPYIEIMTYMALVRCPTPEFSLYLREKLAGESVNHVTSYIWSHLRNQALVWTNDIVEDLDLKAKYASALLKYSRNFRKNVVLVNNTFVIDADLVISSYLSIPQYLALKVASESFGSNPIFEVEVRQKNRTVETLQYNSQDHYSSKPNVTKTIKPLSLITVKSNGIIVYTSERPILDSMSQEGAVKLYKYVVDVVTRKLLTMSTFYWLKLFMRRFAIEYNRGFDIFLQYPTSTGMPFTLQMNKTDGLVRDGLFSTYAKQIDCSMTVDAAYTNVGTKSIAQYSVHPNINVTYAGTKGEIVIELPEKTTKIIEFDFRRYNVENNVLSPRFAEEERPMKTFCLPALKELVGTTLCYEFCPKAQWWPLTSLSYSLSRQRNDGFKGYFIKGSLGKIHNQVSVGMLGGIDKTWSAEIYDLAQFINVRIQCPYGSLNGSGIWRTEVLRQRESGQAVNVSGLVRYKDRIAPFTLTSDSFLEDDGHDNFNIYFNSSLLNTTVLTSHNRKNDDKYIYVNIPYYLESDPTQHNISIHYEYNSTRDKIEEVISEESNTTGSETTTVSTDYRKSSVFGSISFSQFPSISFLAEGVDEEYDGHRSNSSRSGYIDVSCSDYSLRTNGSGLTASQVTNYNWTIECMAFNDTYLFNKTVLLGYEESRICTSMTCNEGLVYEVVAEFECDKERTRGQAANLTIHVPMKGPDASYPLLDLQCRQGLNFYRQDMYLNCTKSYMNKSANLTLVAGDKHSPGEFVAGQPYEHQLALVLTCENKEPFTVTAASSLSDSIRELDLSVNISAPTSSWNKDAIRLKLQKEAGNLKGLVVANRRDAAPYNYEVEGTVEDNLITNLAY